LNFTIEIMSQGFTVNVGALSAGGQDVAGLLSSVRSAASDVTAAISGMAGSASGHAGLASALSSVAESSAQTFLELGAAYQHVGASLAATASTYAQAERANVASVSTIGGEQ
jgi:hypothetical protein